MKKKVQKIQGLTPTLFLWLTLVYASAGFAWEDRICPHFVLKGAEGVSLTENELRLVCGDAENEAWDNIPDNQAMFHLKTFLQLRGFHSPKLIREKQDRIVELGPKTKVSDLTLKGQSPEWPGQRMRKIRGQVLTPDFLDQTEKRLSHYLKRDGYACPSVKTQADPSTGLIVANIDAGRVDRIASVRLESDLELDKDVLRRYDAFQVGEIFNEDWVQLSANRAVKDGALDSSHFEVSCDTEGAHLVQIGVAGPPRQLTIGLGADTENIVRTKLSLKWLRLGKQLSNFETIAMASFRQQEVSFLGTYYYWPDVAHYYLRPILSFKHENENPYEVLKSDLQLAPTFEWDWGDFNLLFSLGPGFQWEHTYRPAPEKDNYFSSMRALVQVTHHLYELYKSSPRGGFDFSLEARASQQGILSDVTAQYFRASASSLWNLFSYDPPLLVFGMRAALATTITPYDRSLLPATLRHYLGGSQDLRGFGRRELAGVAGTGALSSFNASAELRLVEVLPWGLQPITFVDTGMLSEKDFALDPPVFWSPGLGMRWESPVGVFRFTAAKGFFDQSTARYPSNASHFTFYLSYGEEF